MTTTHEYECSNGHGAESRKPISRCPAFVHGAPCRGSLRAVGDGAQAENRRLKAEQSKPTDEPTHKPRSRTPMTSTASTTTKPRGAVPVPLPKPTPATVETLTAALARIDKVRSSVIDEVLYVAPHEGQPVVTAITEHMRDIMKADRSANAYREVQMRGVRSAVIEALKAKGETVEVPKATRTSSAPKKATPAKRASKASTKKKAPAKKSGNAAKQARDRQPVESRLKAS